MLDSRLKSPLRRGAATSTRGARRGGHRISALECSPLRARRRVVRRVTGMAQPLPYNVLSFSSSKIEAVRRSTIADVGPKPSFRHKAFATDRARCRATDYRATYGLTASLKRAEEVMFGSTVELMVAAAEAQFPPKVKPEGGASCARATEDSKSLPHAQACAVDHPNSFPYQGRCRADRRVAPSRWGRYCV